jgi:hypothetical protein
MPGQPATNLSAPTSSRWSLRPGVDGDSVFSPDGRYRYWLERVWDGALPRFCYVLLNPSRADHRRDDPTTRKLQTVTAANGGGGYVLVNLFAAIDTSQAGLHRWQAVGESRQVNDGWIEAAVGRSTRIVVGWGAGNGAAPHAGDRRQAIVRRARAVWSMLDDRELWCVGHNHCGSPRHPGRGIKRDAVLSRYVPTDGYPWR